MYRTLPLGIALNYIARVCFIFVRPLEATLKVPL